jgi:hypothetical protein
MTIFVPIYTSQGDCSAYLGYPYIYDLNGEWIAFVTEDRTVYSIFGEYIGTITNDPRIVRTVSSNRKKKKHTPPPAPQRVRIIRATAIAPMMTDLPNSQVDVLQDEPFKFFGRS